MIRNIIDFKSDAEIWGLLNPKSGDYFGLNDVAASFWKHNRR